MLLRQSALIAFLFQSSSTPHINSLEQASWAENGLGIFPPLLDYIDQRSTTTPSPFNNMDWSTLALSLTQQHRASES
jgi:hypothetical protein